ncbi:hypothetical protein RvY_13203 [Ramazzottius varieornatus]|uniref:Uncharacterized protein n=1 Tax=Ramazzottius varieornatus TaxID=947166 RepID=A0A1D1VM47_RAMVA|nr:hypothetical protein RvY_13203 [Ramazzottius varieornatus]
MEPNSKEVWLVVAASAAVALFIFALFVVFLFWWRRKLKDLKARSRQNDCVTYYPFDDPARACGISNIGYDMEDSRSLSPSEAARENGPSELLHGTSVDCSSETGSRAVSPDRESPPKF